MSNPDLKYQVHLSNEQRQRLRQISRNGQAPAKMIRHAQVLLLSDQAHEEGQWRDQQISEALGMHINTVARIRKRFVFEGEMPALTPRPRVQPPVPPKLDGAAHAHLVAICCSTPPAGQARWSLSLLVKELKARGIVTEICRETVRRSLKKINYDLGRNSATASPSLTPLDS